jgi:hypothetical protein
VASGLSKKKRIPIRKRTISLSLINDKKTDLNCELYGMGNVLMKLHLQNFFKFPCPSKGLCVPIFWAKRWRQLPPGGRESNSTTFPHCLVDKKKKPFTTNFFRQRFNPPSLNSQFEDARFIAIIRMEFQFYRRFFTLEAYEVYYDIL